MERRGFLASLLSIPVLYKLNKHNDSEKYFKSEIIDPKTRMYTKTIACSGIIPNYTHYPYTPASGVYLYEKGNIK